jgi:hypothetical protein
MSTKPNQVNQISKTEERVEGHPFHVKLATAINHPNVDATLAETVARKAIESKDRAYCEFFFFFLLFLSLCVCVYVSAREGKIDKDMDIYINLPTS